MLVRNEDALDVMYVIVDAEAQFERRSCKSLVRRNVALLWAWASRKDEIRGLVTYKCWEMHTQTCARTVCSLLNQSARLVRQSARVVTHI